VKNSKTEVERWVGKFTQFGCNLESGRMKEKDLGGILALNGGGSLLELQQRLHSICWEVNDGHRHGTLLGLVKKSNWSEKKTIRVQKTTVPAKVSLRQSV